MTVLLPPAALERVLAGLIAAELAAAGRRLPPAEVARWDGALELGAAGLALDSLELLACGAAANRFFHLHESGIEDMLLMQPRLAGWADIVARSLAESAERLTFHTSGSTGEPKPVTHAVARLEEEAAHWAAAFAGRTRIVALVPAHHIYGFLFTALLPARLGVPVLDARGLAPGALSRALSGTDLLVGHPTSLEALRRSLDSLPAGLAVTTSTAPMPPPLHAALRRMGAAEVIEIYGSSETAGVAERRAPDAPFRLLPGWRAGAGGDAASVIGRADGVEHALPDRAEWVQPGALRLLGRKDEAVQVGGINVFPQAVAARIRALPGVADCAVRLDATLAEPRLKAFVVPLPGADGAKVAADVEAHARIHWPAPERPVQVAHGAALPRNGMGKVADWSIRTEAAAA